MGTPSQAAIDLIVDAEVSSQAVYEKRYRRPTWPEGSSGVTIGIGYDCGYVSTSELWTDWHGRIADVMIQALDQHAVGIRGEMAHAAASWLKGAVDVPWQVAMDEFTQQEVPKYSKEMEGALPNTNMLSDDSYGALLSLTYNRGPSYLTMDDRHREMRNIRAFMQTMQFTRIPYEIRSMKRLWPKGSGLLARRDAEADLFQQGLPKPVEEMK